MKPTMIVTLASLAVISSIVSACGGHHRGEELDCSATTDAEACYGDEVDGNPRQDADQETSLDPGSDADLDTDSHDPDECVRGLLDCCHGIFGLEDIEGCTTLMTGLILSLPVPTTEPLRCLTTVTGSVEVMLDEVPDNLVGLRSLAQVHGELSIGSYPGLWQNRRLTSLDALGSLERVGGLHIEGALDLEDVNGLRSLRYVGGNLDISGNRSLRGGDEAMSGLAVIGGSVTIEDDERLASLEMLRDVQMVLGALSLKGLPQVSRLDGLRSLRYVGLGLEINDTGLIDLSGLRADVVVGNQDESVVSIVENHMLPTCEAEALVARLRASGWTGTAVIEGNRDDLGCE